MAKQQSKKSMTKNVVEGLKAALDKLADAILPPAQQPQPIRIPTKRRRS